MDSKYLELIELNKCYAIIPARSGSKTVINKNIREFNGHSLLAYSIASAELSLEINRVVVSTDSEYYAEIARKYGAETPFLRPAEISGDDSLDIEFVEHAIEWFAKNEGKIPEYWVHLRPTTPIRNPEIIDKAIELIKMDKEASSLRSGHLCIHPPYKWLKKGANDRYLSPLMPGMTCDEANMPRQDFYKVYIPNGYVDVLKSSFIIKNGMLHGDRMIGFETEEMPDIDTENDLKKLDMYPLEKEAYKKLYECLNEKG